MKAVIMAGGFGTRLRPLTYSIPKPMVPMMNKPMMQHIIELLRHHNINEMVATLFYQPEIITSYFGDGKKLGVTLNYVRAEADYGTAGSVRNAAEYLNDRFIVISGDVLTDFDLTKAIQFHEEQKAKVTIILTRVPNPLQFGVVITDDEGNITRFLEKPSWGEVFSDTINTGIYIIEPDVLNLIPYREEFDFSNNIFPLLMEQKEKLCGYIAEGYWRDIGTLNEYQEAHFDCLSRRVKVGFSGIENGDHFIGIGTEIKSKWELLSGTVVIGENCKIAENVRISNSVLGDNCVIESGAVIRNSVLWNSIVVERNSQLSSDVIGNNTRLQEKSFISDSVFIAERCTVGRGAHLAPNIKLWPQKTVEDGAILAHSLVWEDRWLRELFADARVSGLSNIEMNPEFGAKLGSSFGVAIGQGKYIVASYDSDNVSRMMSRALICGLLSAGCHVNDLQAMPIPLVRHELSTGKESAGFHVRKSPRNPQQTDIIFFDAGGKDLSKKRTKSIERFFFGEDYLRASASNVGTINFPQRTAESYRVKFFEHIDEEYIKKKKLKIVVDYANGVASTIFPNILGYLECEVVALNAYLDPNRLAKTPDEVQESIATVGRIVTSLKYDIGCIIDAGGEKITIIDEHGEEVASERLLTLVTKLFLTVSPHTQRIAVPVSGSAEIDMIAEEHNVKVTKTKTAHLAMMEAASDPQIKFVGGTKGGFIFPDFFFAVDGMYSFAKILEMLAKTKQRLGVLNKQTISLCSEMRDVKCSWENKGKLMRYLMKETEKYSRELVDGVRITIRSENASSKFILVIPDKEEPYFHLLAEAATQEEANHLADEYVEKLLQWRDLR
jgi:mannose-1-phosphate guanylyltransferase/phosphomannomutase